MLFLVAIGYGTNIRILFEYQKIFIENR